MLIDNIIKICSHLNVLIVVAVIKFSIHSQTAAGTISTILKLQKSTQQHHISSCCSLGFIFKQSEWSVRFDMIKESILLVQDKDRNFASYYSRVADGVQTKSCKELRVKMMARSVMVNSQPSNSWLQTVALINTFNITSCMLNTYSLDYVKKEIGDEGKPSFYLLVGTLQLGNLLIFFGCTQCSWVYFCF